MNFMVTKERKLEELRSQFTELVHVPTGARVMHIGNDDPENLFCLSFQTLPNSSNGVAHILEHTVLCGSKKFPTKDPFFSMTRRSLNTFMNAFTGHDFTCYPASSQIEKDFYNLLEVYLDAVFSPLLKKESFRQEGHRLEFVGDQLTYQGIVYNEMKGAMSSPDSRLWQEISKRLLSDLTYAYNSGGDPVDIPRLSYEELKEFHQLYYHPSRCLFYFYGNIPLKKHLDFIERHALKNVEKQGPLPPLPLQTRQKEPIVATSHYPGEGKTMIAFCWLTAPIHNARDVLTLCLLESILLETDASPLKKALLKSGLCTDVESSVDIEMSEVPFTIRCSGTEEKHREALQKLIWEVLAEPIDPDLVEAALHQLELERTEISPDGGPFGLSLFFRGGLIKQHGVEPENGLLVHTLFNELRDRLEDPEYLPSILRKYLIENTHLVVQTLVPDPTLGKKEQEAEMARLSKIHLTPEEIEEIRKKPDEPKDNVDCLPKLALSDIPPKVKDFPLIHKGHTYRHDCFTNQFIYANLVFDLPKLEVEELPMLSLLTQMWTELGCGGNSYEETLQEMQRYTGGIDAMLSTYVSSKGGMRPALILRGKALERNEKPFFDLLTRFAERPDFSDHERILEWLKGHATDLENSLADSAAGYASGMALSSQSKAAFISNQWGGLPYYQFVQKLQKKKDWIEEMKALADRLCCKTPDLVISGKGEYSFKPTGKHDPWVDHFKANKPMKEAFTIPAAVAFTTMAMHTEPGSAELMLSAKLLKNVVLHKEIREKGGAYGSGASYSLWTGDFALTAYRDPNLSRTLETFEKALEVIGNGEFSDRELEEAKISYIGDMDSPTAPGGRAMVAYSWKRAERTLAERQAFREHILSADRESIAKAVKKLKPTSVVSLLGEELWKKENGKVDLKLGMKL